MTSLLGVFLALVGPFLLQNVQGLLHVVTTSTAGLETAGLAEESWHDKRGLTMAFLVGFVMGSLSVLDQGLDDYELRSAFGMASSQRWRIFGPFGDVFHVGRAEHGLLGCHPTYQEGRVQPKLMYAIERHSRGDLA